MHNDGAVEYEDDASATEAQDCLSLSLRIHLCVIYAAHTCLTMQLNIYIYIPQMGRDIVSFLSWAAEPEMEERKLMGFKWIFVLPVALLQAACFQALEVVNSQVSQAGS